jgi:hypothetical protein
MVLKCYCNSSNNFSPRSKSHNLYFDIPLWNKTGQLDHFLAKSMILLAYPYQIYISPPLPIAPASRTNWQASGMVIKYHNIRLIVTGPPLAICLLNKGTTEPLEPKTFRNGSNKFCSFYVILFRLFNCNDWTYFSAILYSLPSRY